jgi:2'-5' RNA ligase
VESRPFKPHITLARIKFARDPDAIRESAAVYSEKHFGSQRAAELVVYSSTLTPNGPIYTPLARAPIGG